MRKYIPGVLYMLPLFCVFAGIGYARPELSISIVKLAALAAVVTLGWFGALNVVIAYGKDE